jgi:hypothetical protein
MKDYRTIIGQIGNEAFSSAFAGMNFSIAIDELYGELADLDIEPMDAEDLDPTATDLIRQIASEISHSATADQLIQVLNSIDEKIAGIAKPARKTVFLILFGIISTYFCAAGNTWWTSYVRDYRTHRIEYEEGVEALKTITEIDPAFSIAQVSGVIRTPCIAVENVGGHLRHSKVSAGTPVKITKRNGKSIEIRWNESDRQLSGWINITHVRYPKRFR